MRTLHIENSEYQLPGHLNEMTVPQLVFLSKLVGMEIPIQEIKVKMLFHCLKAKIKRMKNGQFHRISIRNHLFAMTTEQVVVAASAFDYLFTKPDKNGLCFFDNRLTRNPYPEIKIRGRKFIAPAEALTDISYNRYIYLETYNSVMQHKPEAIYTFMACLFRRPNTHFNPDDLNLKYLKRLKPDMIVLMCWFYIGSIRFIADKFPRIFPADGEGGNGESVYDGQMHLLDFMAKADPTKKRLIREDKLYDVLYSLDYMLEEMEKNSIQ
jgi:hypothetical protein